MISISDDAVAYAIEKQSPIHIGIPYKVSGCCFDLTECPSVSFGQPREATSHERLTISGITVFVPKDFPDDKPMVIKTRSLLGFRQLILDGWQLV